MSDSQAIIKHVTPQAQALARKLREVVAERTRLAKTLRQITEQRPESSPPATESAGSGPTVAECLDAYKARCIREGCRSDPLLSLLDKLRRYFAGRRFADITTQDVEQLVEDHLAAGYKPASVQSYIGYLRAAMRYTCRRENRSLASLPYFPSLKFQNARQGFFESEEFAAILVGLPEPYDDIARFGYATGWRLSEILSLQWAQVDRERRVIRLPRSKNGEGRIIPLIGERLALIERRWQRRAYRNRLSEWVFHRKGRRVSRDYCWRHWMWARTEAGLPHKLFHDLRRTFARDFIEAGGDYKTAMNITGHRTMRTFLRYQISDMRGMERGLEAMDAKRNGNGRRRGRADARGH